MDYPRMLYLFPAAAIHGEPAALQDGTYSTLIAGDEAEQGDAQARGWGVSPAEARAKYDLSIAAALSVPQEPEAPAEPDVTPPTRAEMEQKATELGIAFRSNTSDKALADRIAAALEQ